MAKQIFSRRRFVLGAALASTAVALAACGQSAAPTQAPAKSDSAPKPPAAAGTKPDAAAAPKAADKPAAAGQVAITFAAHGNQAEQEFYKKAVDMFNAKNPNIKASFQAEPTNNWEKYLTLMAGGTMYDTFRNEEKRLPEFVHRGEQLLDLTSHSQKDKIDKEDFPPTVWEEFFWKGKMYGFGHDLSPAVLFINRKIWKERGVEIPTTWGDPKWNWQAFVEATKKLTYGEGAQRVFGIIGNTWWVYAHPWVWSNGGTIVAEDDMTVTLDKPETVEALQYYVDLNRVHKVMPQANEMADGPAQLFESGRAAMNINNTSYTIRMRQMKDFDWEMIPYPTGSKGVFTRIPNNCCSAYSKTKAPDAAWEYLKHMASKEVTIEARGMPSRISAAKTDEFLKRTPSQNWKLLADSGAIRKIEPRTPFFGEFDRELRAAWESAQNGTVTVKEMVADMKPKLTKILKGES